MGRPSGRPFFVRERLPINWDKDYPVPPMRILLLASLLLPALALAEVYRWTDSDGVVHYSDQPAPDAERAELPKLQTVESPTETGGDSVAETPEKTHSPALTLAGPDPETTFRDARGLVPVRVSMDRELGRGERLVYYLDGNPVVEARKTRVQLEGVERGTHRLHAALKSGDRELARTRTVTVYVKPPSALSPVNQNAGNNDSQPDGAPASPATNQSGGAPAAPRFDTNP